MSSGGYVIQRPGARGVRRAPLLASASQRALFAFALVTFFFASTYTGVALLSRVTPALFPGRSLKDFGVVATLDRFVPVPEASAEGSFRDPIHILILGIDKRPQYQFDETLPYLTDVVMVANTDPVTKKTTLLSFPRDMVIEVHPKSGGHYLTRINNSYGLGVEQGKTRAAGIDQVKRDMKENFGIDIQYSMVLDFKGVEGLVDALGGVTVDITPELAVDPWYYSDDDRNAQYVSFPAGVTTLDGYHAVAFGRQREQDSDLVRVKRQQLVVKAALEKSFSSGLLAKNPLDLWEAYGKFVKTDVPVSVMPGLADLLKQTNGSMQTLSVGDPVDGVPTMTPGVLGDDFASVLYADTLNVQYWLARAFPVTRHPDAIVELQSGYGDTDLGNSRLAALGHFLVYSRGMVTVYYGSDQPQTAQTVVKVHRDGQRGAAEDIADWLGLGSERVVDDPVDKDDTGSPDITVVVGRDFVIPGTH